MRGCPAFPGAGAVISSREASCVKQFACTPGGGPSLFTLPPADPTFAGPMSDLPTRELFERYVVPTYARFPLRLVKGSGTRVWDEDGKEYLDFGAGIAVTSLGHGHPRVMAALQKQMAELVHVSNLYYSRQQGLLAERLVRLVGRPGKVFFCNSGAEA